MDSMGSDASGRVSADQKARTRFSVKFNQAKGDSLPTEGGAHKHLEHHLEIILLFMGGGTE